MKAITHTGGRKDAEWRLLLLGHDSSGVCHGTLSSQPARLACPMAPLPGTIYLCSVRMCVRVYVYVCVCVYVCMCVCVQQDWLAQWPLYPVPLVLFLISLSLVSRSISIYVCIVLV